MSSGAGDALAEERLEVDGEGYGRRRPASVRDMSESSESERSERLESEGAGEGGDAGEGEDAGEGDEAGTELNGELASWIVSQLMASSGRRGPGVCKKGTIGTIGTTGSNSSLRAQAHGLANVQRAVGGLQTASKRAECGVSARPGLRSRRAPEIGVRLLFHTGAQLARQVCIRRALRRAWRGV
jgi:hypothetical protein